MSTGSTRRADIVAAAHTCFANGGYERTSTASICRAAGVSSGTFFHYFPTKSAVLVAVLEHGLAETRTALGAVAAMAASDAWAALDLWREHLLAEARDEDLAGFAAAISSLPDDEVVAAVLAAEAELTDQTLAEVVRLGQQQCVIRSDLGAVRAATWLSIIAEGILSHALQSTPAQIDALGDEAQSVLARLLRP